MLFLKPQATSLCKRVTAADCILVSKSEETDPNAYRVVHL